MEKLDHFDLQILSILQQNNFTSQSEIGEKVGLSAPAVQRRIKRMREEEIIVNDISVLDPEKLGNPIIVIVDVKMEADKIEIVNKAKQLFINTPQVQQCYYVTGEVDFILVITVFSMKEYEELTHTLFFKNDFVKQFKTSISMDVIKRSLSIPILNPRG